MNLLSSVVLIQNEDQFLQLAKLYGKINAAGPQAYFNWNQQTALDEIRAAANLAAMSEGHIKSFITYRNYDDRLEVSALGTDPDLQHLGYGQLLLKELKKCATGQKKPIWLEVHEHNIKALRLYQSGGFMVVNRRKSYYSDLADAFVMTWTDGSA